MRNIKYIAVHCTASSQHATIKELLLEFKRKGWSKPGYHHIVDVNGKVFNTLSEDEVSNGVKGFNSNLINVAYIGGIDTKGKPVDNRTEEQKKSLLLLLKALRKKYQMLLFRDIGTFHQTLIKTASLTHGSALRRVLVLMLKSNIKTYKT